MIIKWLFQATGGWYGSARRETMMYDPAEEKMVWISSAQLTYGGDRLQAMPASADWFP